MKKGFFIFILSLLLVSPVMAQDAPLKITESFDNMDLRDVLRYLNEKYEIKFAYDDALVVGNTVNLSFQDNTAEEVISQLLKAVGLDYRLVNQTFMILPVRMSPESVQLIKVIGEIRDRSTGEALPFANILIEGTMQSVASNPDGKFSISSVADTSSLNVHYLGYRPETVRLKDFPSGQISVGLASQAEELEEVVVVSDRSGILELSDGLSQVSFNPQKISNLPSLGEFDVFRTLQLLPGISATDETSSGLAVRGSSPDQNLVLYDGFTLYHIDHFYGVYSAFNSNAIKNIQLLKGGFDAKYGGRASSVIDITGKNGSNEPSLGLGVNLIGANAIGELPVGDKARVLVAYRRSYTDIIQSDLYKNLFDNVFSNSIDARTENIPQLADIEPVFFFYDLNAKVTYNPTDRDIVAFSYYNSKDNLNLGSTEFLNDNIFTSISEDTQWGNTGASIRWGRQWNSGFYTNLYLAASNFFSDTEIEQQLGFVVPDTTFVFNLIQNNDVEDITLKMDNEYTFSAFSSLQFGVLYTGNKVKLTSQFQDNSFQLLNQDAEQFSGYFQYKWNPIDPLELNLGLRANYFNLLEENFWEPRLSAKYNLTPKLTLKGAAGVNHQFINRIVRQELFQSNPDFWILSGDGLPEVEARQYVLGFLWENDMFVFDTEAYYKFSDGIIEYIPRLSNFQQATQVSGNLYRIGEGTTKGIDFLLEKKKGKYTGWISYTLSKSENSFDGLNDGEVFPSRLVQRHELKLVNMYNWKKWDFALNFIYGSGKPYSAPSGTYTLTFLDSARQTYAAIDNFNAERLPAYHRMDFSATYNFNMGKGKAQAGLSIFNLYGRKNIKFRRFTRINLDPVDGGFLDVPQFAVNDVTLLGFTPNIFFRYEL